MTPADDIVTHGDNARIGNDRGAYLEAQLARIKAAKKANPMKAAAKGKTLKAKTLKKKAVTFKAVTVKGAYKVPVKVTAARNGSYKAASMNEVVKVTVK